MKNKFILLFALLVTTLLISNSCNNQTKTKDSEKKVPPFDVANMDTSVKPWEDFDAYANGNWKKIIPFRRPKIPGDHLTSLTKRRGKLKSKG